MGSHQESGYEAKQQPGSQQPGFLLKIDIDLRSTRCGRGSLYVCNFIPRLYSGNETENYRRDARLALFIE